MSVVFDWKNPNMPRMAKLQRADVHIDRLAELSAKIDPATYWMDFETGDGDETHLRITEAMPIPVEVSTVLGDAVHNLRSALDTVAYELARMSNGGTLTPEQEELTAFPVRESPEDYDTFFGGRRKALFDTKAEKALRSVAPGCWFSSEAIVDGELIMTFREEVTRDKLWQLHRLSIIDKHRRLSVIALWPEPVYWMNTNGEDSPDWRWGTPPFEKGSIVGTFIGGSLPTRQALTAELELRIAEPRVLPSEGVVETVRRFATYIEHWVLPRIWQGY
jgi:hypothetical protein